MISSPSSLELLEESNSMIYPSLVQAVTTDKTISNITRAPGYLLHRPWGGSQSGALAMTPDLPPFPRNCSSGLCKCTHPRTRNPGTSILRLEEFLRPYFSSIETVAEDGRSMSCNFQMDVSLSKTPRIDSSSSLPQPCITTLGRRRVVQTPKGHLLQRHQGDVRLPS